MKPLLHFFGRNAVASVRTGGRAQDVSEFPRSDLPQLEIATYGF